MSNSVLTQAEADRAALAIAAAQTAYALNNGGGIEAQQKRLTQVQSTYKSELEGEQLYADVEIKNDDVGFVQVGQTAHIKLAAYPFQKYGMLDGEVIRISADAGEMKPATTQGSSNGAQSNSQANALPVVSTYKVRLKLEQQQLTGPGGRILNISPGMQVVAEINQGKRTVLEYLLSPIKKQYLMPAKKNEKLG